MFINKNFLTFKNMEIKTIKLSSKGQLCIPQEMRKEAGFKEGEKLILIAKTNEIRIQKSKKILDNLDKEGFETISMSEEVLKKDWNNKRDDKA